WGSRPETIGDWQLAYDRLGSRLRRVGPYPVGYGMLGSRVETIGPMRLRYDRLGNRAKRVELPPDVPELTEDLLVALFFVLYHVERVKESRRRREPSGG